MKEEPTAPVILYDGVCGLCNSFNTFVLRHDRKAVFRFAPLQSEFATVVLARHEKNASELDTVYLLENDALYMRADAALRILKRLGGIWKLSVIFRIVPKFLQNAAYNWIARNRYRIFGKYDTCPVPDPKWKDRFLES